MTPHDDILAALDLLHASYPDTAWSLSRRIVAMVGSTSAVSSSAPEGAG